MKRSFIDKDSSVLSFLLHYYFQCRFTKCEAVGEQELPCVRIKCRSYIAIRAEETDQSLCCASRQVFYQAPISSRFFLI